MRPEGGKVVGGAGSPCGEGADVAEGVVAAESARCEVLDGEGACWAILVAATGVSAEAVPPPEGTAKTESKAVSAAAKFSSAGTAVVDGDGGRYTSDESPRRSRRVVNYYVLPVCTKITNIRRDEREPTQHNALRVGHQPTQANTGDRRRTGTKPAGPDEEDTTIVHGGEAADSSGVVFRCRLWQT